MKDVIQLFPEVEWVELLGASGDAMDIKYRLIIQDVDRAVQVKQLVELPSSRDSYAISIHRPYAIGSLLLFVNLQRDKFAMVQVTENFPDYLTFNFNTMRCRTIPSAYMTKNLAKFKCKLLKMLAISPEYVETLTPLDLRAKQSLLRLKNQCIAKGLSYVDAESRSFQYDCIIEGKKWQHKASDNIKHPEAIVEKFTVCCHKTVWYQREKKQTPYLDIDDFYGFVFELIPYSGQFFFVPKHILIQLSIVQTPTVKGKTTFQVAAPHEKPDSLRPYLNNWSFCQPLTASAPPTVLTPIQGAGTDIAELSLTEDAAVQQPPNKRLKSRK